MIESFGEKPASLCRARERSKGMPFPGSFGFTRDPPDSQRTQAPRLAKSLV